MSEALDAIRTVIQESESSGYRIAIDSGVSQSQLSRFLTGKSKLSIESAEAALKAIGYRLEVVPIAVVGNGARRKKKAVKKE